MALLPALWRETRRGQAVCVCVCVCVHAYVSAYVCACVRALQSLMPAEVGPGRVPVEQPQLRVEFRWSRVNLGQGRVQMEPRELRAGSVTADPRDERSFSTVLLCFDAHLRAALVAS